MHVHVRGILTASLVLFSAPVLAANQPVHDPDDLEYLLNLSVEELANYRLPEFSTLATREESSVQDVSIPVSVVDQRAISFYQKQHIDDIAATTPNFTISHFNRLTPQLYIRGIGSNFSGAGDDPSVGIFFNEVYISRTGYANMNLYDMDRVEVLRGPQGTLWGKNVAGGAMHFVPHKADFENNQELVLTLGNRKNRSINGYINSVFANKSWSNRFTFVSNNKAGFVENETTGESLGGRKNTLLREQLSGVLTDNLSLNFLLQTANDSWGDQPVNYYGDELFFSDKITPYRNVENSTAFAPGKGEERHFDLISIQLQWDKPGFKLSSLSSYFQGDYSFDNGGTTEANLITNTADENSRTWQQEFRIEGKPRDNLNYTAGLFLMWESIHRDESLGTQGFQTLLGTPVTPQTPAVVTYNVSNETQSSALYGQTTLGFSSAWALTLGGRLTHEQKNFAVDTRGSDFVAGLLLNNQAFHIKEDKQWDNFSGRLALTHQPSDDLMSYVSYSEGFKSGAFNQLATSEMAARQASDPELSKNIEVGIKSDFLDKKLRINSTVFYTDYADLQVLHVDSLGNFTVGNTADAEIKGLELELAVLPLKGLEVMFNLGVLDAEYKKDEFGGGIFKGNKLPRAPSTSAYARLRHFGVISQYRYELAVDADLRARTYYTAANTKSASDDARTLYNVYFSLEPHSGDYRLGLWVKNLLDEQHNQFALDAKTLGLANRGQFVAEGERLSFGLSLSLYPQW